jgi:hypothetical protein
VKKIKEVSLFVSNGKTNINIWRKGSDCPKRYEISSDQRGLTIQKILNKDFTAGNTMIYVNTLIVHYYPKPTGKPVEAKPAENNYYICPRCHGQMAFSSWVYAHWDISTVHHCICGAKNIIRQGMVVSDGPVDEYHILDAKFYPEKDGKQIVAVAVAGQINDWAGYISTVSASAMPSKVVQLVAAEGVKLLQAEAEGMFPGHWAWKRDYRR